MSDFGATRDRAARTSSACFFDVLHVDGRPVDRRAPRDAHASCSTGVVPPRPLLPGVVTDDADVADARSSTEAARRRPRGRDGEGARLDVPGGSARRDWRKVKPVHTLDLVVLAAEWGHGRRTGLAVATCTSAPEAPTATFVMVGKTFKGMTDELLRWQTEQLHAGARSATEGHVVHVRPELVVEIALDGVQVSTAVPGRRRAALRPRASLPRRTSRPADADTIATVHALLR